MTGRDRVETPKALLLVDWQPVDGSRLLEALRQNGLDCDIIGIDFHPNRWTPLNKLINFWPKCLWLSLKVFAGRRRYDYVLAWQQVMGLFLGLFKFFTCSSRPRVFILTAVFVERKNPLLNGIRNLFLSAALKKVDLIGFLSDHYREREAARFHIPGARAVTLKYPLLDENLPPHTGFKAESYLYSVGVSYRDYETLVAAARLCPRPFVVATNDSYLRGISLPANVTVHYGCFGKDQEELLSQAAAVILPLAKTTSPAAEATMVVAMSHGKPVIATRTVTTGEYIIEGVNGLLVPWKDAQALAEAVEYLFAHPKLATAMGINARQWVMENNSLDGYAKKIIASLLASHPSK